MCFPLMGLTKEQLIIIIIGIIIALSMRRVRLVFFGCGMRQLGCRCIGAGAAGMKFVAVQLFAA